MATTNPGGGPSRPKLALASLTYAAASSQEEMMPDIQVPPRLRRESDEPEASESDAGAHSAQVDFDIKGPFGDGRTAHYEVADAASDEEWADAATSSSRQPSVDGDDSLDETLRAQLQAKDVLLVEKDRRIIELELQLQWRDMIEVQVRADVGADPMTGLIAHGDLRFTQGNDPADPQEQFQACLTSGPEVPKYAVDDPVMKGLLKSSYYKGVLDIAMNTQIRNAVVKDILPENSPVAEGIWDPGHPRSVVNMGYQVAQEFAWSIFCREYDRPAWDHRHESNRREWRFEDLRPYLPVEKGTFWWGLKYGIDHCGMNFANKYVQETGVCPPPLQEFYEDWKYFNRTGKVRKIELEAEQELKATGQSSGSSSGGSGSKQGA